MDNALVEACDNTGDTRLAPALAAMGISKLIMLLGWRASFQPGAQVSDVELGSFASEIRRERAEDTPVTTVCGDYPTLAAGPAALPILRTLVLAARIQATAQVPMGLAIGGGAPAPAPAVDPDELKPLPPKTIADIWTAGQNATGGYSSVLPSNQLSDHLVSRMSRSNKAGQIWMPAVDANFGYKEQSSTRARITPLLKAAGATLQQDVQLQLVQAGQSLERTVEVEQPLDYDSVCKHRSAAMIACYSTPQAAAEYQVSASFAGLQKHTTDGHA